MNNIETTENAKKKANKYNVTKKLEKQAKKLASDTRDASLWFRPLVEQKSDGVWKFRLDKHYWGLVIKTGPNSLKIYDVIKHLK